MNTPIGTAGASGGAAAGVTVIAAWLLSLAHVQVPPEVAAAFGSLLGIAIHYLATQGNYRVARTARPPRRLHPPINAPVPRGSSAAVARALGVAQQPGSV